MVGSSFLFAVLGAEFILLASQGEVRNPEYLFWVNFPVGSSITFRGEKTTAGMKSESRSTYFLRALNPDQATIGSHSTVFVGERRADLPDSARVIRSMISQDDKRVLWYPSGSSHREGTEYLLVGDKRLECRWIENSWSEHGSLVTFRFWLSGEVPGGIVRKRWVYSGTIEADCDAWAVSWTRG